VDEHKPDVPQPIALWPVWLKWVVLIVIVVVVAIAYFVLLGPQIAAPFNHVNDMPL
jgi:hypothetical protein